MAAASGRTGTFRLERVRVLVVDDSPVMRAVVKGYLRSTGFEIDEAGDVASALRLCDACDYDVVVSDVTMPGLDGLDLVHALDRRAVRPEVVLLTASSDLARESAQRGVSLVGHECLAKPPAAPDTVVLAVERALRKKRDRDRMTAS